MSKTFCILPWIHTQTKPNGQIKPCCRFDIKHPDYKTETGYKFDGYNINNMSYYDAVNSTVWNEIKLAMLEGQTVPGCRKCYQEDDFQFNYTEDSRKSLRSMRVKENTLWNNDNQVGVDTINTPARLRYIELALGNYCNLKCRTCNGNLSTTWYDDEHILSAHYPDRKFYNLVLNVDNDWYESDFNDVEEIKFTGGEPMLHPNFTKTLDMLIATGRANLIKLDIFTNASWIPREKVLSRLRQFKFVTINLSVDGIAHVNDYIRYPSEWATVHESVKEWLMTEKKYSMFSIRWAPVISIFNVWVFHKMIEWWFNLQHEVKQKPWWQIILNKDDTGTLYTTMIVNIVYDPDYLNPSLYPNKKLLVSKLLADRDRWIQTMTMDTDNDPHMKNLAETTLMGIYYKVLSSVNSKEESIDIDKVKQFIEFTADLDRIRGQDLRVNLHNLWKRFEGMVEYRGKIND